MDRITIITVAYNAGDSLMQTVNSVLEQDDPRWQMIIKDGGSTDGSVERLKDVCGDDSRIHILIGRDKGIYDAMNIAVSKLREYRESEGQQDTGNGQEYRETKRIAGQQEAAGDTGYVIFLGCGDILADKEVISHIREAIDGRWYLEAVKEGRSVTGSEPVIFYGDVRERTTGQRVASNPKMDDYGCYRNVPCHQACIYDERLLFRYPFDTRWKVRSDYEQFLRMRYSGGARSIYIQLLIAEFAGGGYSETAENLRISEEERKQIIALYLPPAQIRKYDLMRAVTLAPLRTKLSRSPVTSGMYNALKSGIYRLRHTGRKCS